MHWRSFFFCLFIVLMIEQVRGHPTMTGKYGETVEIPCDIKNIKPEDVMMTKWKYDGDGSVLVKSTGHNASVDATYKTRASLKEDLSLVITHVTMTDQRVFTCQVVAVSDIFEYHIKLIIYKEPSAPRITNKTTAMEIGKLTTLAECHTEAASPAANITWFKNKTPLLPDAKAVNINTVVTVDPATQLSSTTSTLDYASVKGDVDATFSCQVQHVQMPYMDSSALKFTVNYPTEKVSLQVLSQGPFKEGDNLTLRCSADGNPPPSSFSFYIKGEKKNTLNSSVFTLTNVTRNHTGEYRCSLLDNPNMNASAQVKVEYLEVVLGATGKIVKRLGDSFETSEEVKTSGNPDIIWRKGTNKLNSRPMMERVKYSDAGLYECVVSSSGLRKTRTFELVVEGPASINNLIKKRGELKNNKIVICEAEGFPKPSVQWSINGTNVAETKYVDGKVSYSITIVPTVDLNVSCTVSNVLASDTRVIHVSTLSDDVTMDKQEDQKDEKTDKTPLIVGIVVGIMLASVAVGVAYWLYMKKSRQGSWKTCEMEAGSVEESKKLEENKSQKAEP